ncbi:putative oxidoreductase ucpA [Exophiala viscosa]|uniref:Oxidoreductase ucpA n=1 Tax=Exophiala viscosa TaxID=2486360 RepID=A0AAN6IEH0_9EURO|nr:putative oxidoreductase ucpA [Exophiala viscosa]
MEYPIHTGYNFTSTIHNDIYPQINPTKSDLSQPGKVVLITGSGRGIGRSTALRYAEAGVAAIVLCARTASQIDETESQVKQINPDVRLYKHAVDVTDEQQVFAMADAVRKAEGRLDVLINNAGTTDKWETITEGDIEAWLKCWDLHIKGTYLMLKAFLPLLTETAEKQSTVVDVLNTTTIAAHLSMPGGSAYMGSKFALMRLSEFVASEYADKGVNCMSLHPGGVDTGIAKDLGPMVQAAMTDTAELCAGFAVWLTKGQRTWLNGRYVAATWDVDELEDKKDAILDGDKLKMRMVV